jgi:hypothetical protein
MNFYLTIIAAIVLFLVAGCGNGNEKSEEELKAELKEELKKELKEETESSESEEAAKSTDSEITNEVRMKDFSVQMAKDAGLEYEKEIFYGKAWNDKNGDNILIFTQGLTTVAEHDDHGGDEERWDFFAYHYADDGSGFELKRQIRDFVTCFFLSGKLFKTSVNITDIDEDGKAEITFVYHVGCSPDGASWYPVKLMMLEDGEKYAIRGITYIPYMDDWKPGQGEKQTEIGGNFKNAPDGFLDFAKTIWEKYRTREAFIDYE